MMSDAQALPPDPTICQWSVMRGDNSAFFAQRPVCTFQRVLYKSVSAMRAFCAFLALATNFVGIQLAPHLKECELSETLFLGQNFTENPNLVTVRDQN